MTTIEFSLTKKGEDLTVELSTVKNKSYYKLTLIWHRALEEPQTEDNIPRPQDLSAKISSSTACENEHKSDSIFYNNLAPIKTEDSIPADTSLYLHPEGNGVFKLEELCTRISKISRRLFPHLFKAYISFGKHVLFDQLSSFTQRLLKSLYYCSEGHYFYTELTQDPFHQDHYRLSIYSKNLPKGLAPIFTFPFQTKAADPKLLHTLCESSAQLSVSYFRDLIDYFLITPHFSLNHLVHFFIHKLHRTCSKHLDLIVSTEDFLNIDGTTCENMKVLSIRYEPPLDSPLNMSRFSFQSMFIIYSHQLNHLHSLQNKLASLTTEQIFLLLSILRNSRDPLTFLQIVYAIQEIVPEFPLEISTPAFQLEIISKRNRTADLKLTPMPVCIVTFSTQDLSDEEPEALLASLQDLSLTQIAKIKNSLADIPLEERFSQIRLLVAEALAENGSIE